MAFREWLYRLIPRIISNRMLLRIMQCMRLLQRHGLMYAVSHYEQNVRTLNALMCEDGFARPKPFVENQRQLTSLYLGLSTMAEAGCEVIAVYNALKVISTEEYSLPDLIEGFEKDGMIRSGRYGVAALAMRDMLKRLGYATEATYKIPQMGELLDKSRVAVLTMFNDRDTIGEQVHSVCVTRSRIPDSDHETVEGYVIHNMYGDGRALGPYKDMDDIMANLRGGRTRPVLLIGVL